MGEGKRSDTIEMYNPGFDEWEVLNVKLLHQIEAFSLVNKNEGNYLIFGGKTIEGDKDIV